MGKYYGSIDDNSSTIIFNEKLLHPFQPYSKQAMTNQINYFLMFLKWMVYYEVISRYGIGKNY